MTALFTEWGVIEWHDLEVFNAINVLEHFQSLFSVSKVIQKRLGYIVDYAKIGELVNSTTICAIVKTVNERQVLHLWWQTRPPLHIRYKKLY